MKNITYITVLLAWSWSLLGVNRSLSRPNQMGKILKGRLCPRPWNLGFLTYGSSLDFKKIVLIIIQFILWRIQCKYILTILCIYHLQVFDFRKNHQWGTFYYTHFIVPVSFVQMTKFDIGMYMLVQSWLLYHYYFFDYHVYYLIFKLRIKLSTLFYRTNIMIFYLSVWYYVI